MKRIFRFLLYLVILLVASAFILPIVFKDSIVDRIKQEANANLNAKLDFEDVNVSLISSFPYFGLDLVGLEISGVDRFENQKLVSVDNFGLYIDLMSVISGDRYSIEEISVEGMDLHVLILADGTANYDIAKVDTTASSEEVSSESSSAFNLALREYRFQDIDFRYQDLEADMDFIIKDLDHQGLGNFTENIVDLKTSTEAQSMTFIMEGVNYLNRVHLASDFDMNLNQEKFEFNFGQNSVALNGLELNFEGMMAMPEEAIDLDLKFSSPSNSFKSLISLIPSIYYQDFDALKTSGEFRLSGAVKGTYVDESYPSFNLALLVREGFFQYPDLPASVQKVNIDLKVENTRADLKNLLVNLSRMDAMVAGSSISSSLRLLDPMNDMQFDFLAKADADLE
ncbi:MAG: AsmA family protein, partial [Croceimicrobium sp.]